MNRTPNEYETLRVDNLIRREIEKRNALRKKAALAAILILGLFIGLTIEKYVIDPMLAPEKAEAAEIESIHQNDFYCAQIAEGNMKVNPKEVSANELLALCSKYL